MGNAVIHFELMSSLFTDPEGRMMGLWKAKQ
jgi:hypothetical protein